MPLVFYVNGNDFNIGHFAKERVNVNDLNSYQDYFSLIQNPTKYFILHGDNKPIKQLLYYGIENHLSHFIKTILFKSDSIESYRSNFCLRFCFEQDVEPQERNLILSLFSESGYENVSEINIAKTLNNIISESYKSEFGRIILSSISNTLFINVYAPRSFEELDKAKIENQGSDPRLKILANLIIEDVKDANPHISIDVEKELSQILGHCVTILPNLTPLIKNNIELSNGVKVAYKIKINDLIERLLFDRGIEDKVIPQIENAIKNCDGLSDNTDIVLIGDEINTGFFKDRLNKRFSNVVGNGKFSEKELLQGMFLEIQSKGYQIIPTIKKLEIPNYTNITHGKETQKPPLIMPFPEIKDKLNVNSPPVFKVPKTVIPPVIKPQKVDVVIKKIVPPIINIPKKDKNNAIESSPPLPPKSSPIDKKNKE